MILEDKFNLTRGDHPSWRLSNSGRRLEHLYGTGSARDKQLETEMWVQLMEAEAACRDLRWLLTGN